MGYPFLEAAQANSLRKFKRRRNMSGRKTQEKEKPPERPPSASAWELAYRFGNQSTIHGFNRLLGRKSGKYERTIWLLTLAIALLGSIYVCLIVADRFRAGKFQTVVDSTRYPVYRIVFPVVTICNLNRLNWQRLADAKERFLPQERDQAKLQLFEQIVATFDDIRFANFDNFSSLEGAQLQQLNHVNFSLVVEFMTWKCEELLTECVWRHRHHNCCKIFSLRRSESGYCWAFNTLETEEGRQKQKLDPMWPWHTGQAGPGSGLKVRVLINAKKHLPKRKNYKGISVMITEPLAWTTKPSLIKEHNAAMIEITPVMHFYSNETRRQSSAQRKCVFRDEQHSRNFKSLPGYIYMLENCFAVCHQEYMMRHCNCTMDLFYPPANYPACKPVDLLCLAKYNEYFRYYHQPGQDDFVKRQYESMKCQCYRNCNSLTYVVDVRSSLLPRKERANESYVDLDVHFRFEEMIVYRTSLVFGWLDLMVSFGGIASLFLGCSLLSIVEVAYFTLIEVPSFIIHQCWKLRNKGIRQVTPIAMLERDYLGKGTQQAPISRKTSWQSFLIPNTTKAYYLNEM